MHSRFLIAIVILWCCKGMMGHKSLETTTGYLRAEAPSVSSPLDR